MPTVCELKAELKAKGVKGVSGKSKAQLETMLGSTGAPAAAKAPKAPKVPAAVSAKASSSIAGALDRLLGRGTGGAPPMSEALGKLRGVEAATKARNDARAAAAAAPAVGGAGGPAPKAAKPARTAMEERISKEEKAEKAEVAKKFKVARERFEAVPLGLIDDSSAKKTIYNTLQQDVAGSFSSYPHPLEIPYARQYDKFRENWSSRLDKSGHRYTKTAKAEFAKLLNRFEAEVYEDIRLNFKDLER